MLTINRTRVLLVTVASCAVGAATYAGVGALAASRTEPPRIDAAPAPGEEPAPHHAQTVDGQRWSLQVFRNAEGETCAGETVPNDGGDGGQGLGCLDLGTALAAHPVIPYFGGRQLRNRTWADAWIWGFAARSVSSIFVVDDATGATIPLRIDSARTFFHVFGGAAKGQWELRAYDRDGALVLDKTFAFPATVADRVGG